MKMNILIAYIPLIVVIMVLTYGMHSRETGQRNDLLDSPSLLLSELNKSRGILSLVVLINHILWINELRMGYISAIWGPLTFSIVFVFFFLSGMGMELKIFTNTMDIIKDACKKITFLLIFDIIVETFEFIMWSVYSSERISYISFVLARTNWYIWELMILYIIFYLSQCISLKFHLTMNCFFTIILFVIFTKYVSDATWYISIFGFSFGMTFVRFEKSIFEFLTNKKWCVTAVLAIAVLLHLKKDIQYPIAYGISENLLSVCFTLIIVIVITHVKLFNNVLCKKLHDISLEIRPLVSGSAP